MKNLKNTISAAALMAVMVFGAVSANAGIMISDRTAPVKSECTVKDTGIFMELLGGIMFGLIISDTPTPGCNNGNGIMISDGNGIMISD